MRYISLFCIFISISVPAWAGDNIILLGVVEDVPGVYYGENHSTKVRALFSHQENHWRAFKSDCKNSECLINITNSFPKEVTWYVGLDGRQIGKVSAKTPPKFNFYAHVGLQDITEGNAPVVGNSSYEFSGFGGELVHRPLVALSKPNFQDPQKWERLQPTSAIVKQALEVMRNKVPSICKEGASETNALIPFNFGQGDLEVQAHKSEDGSLLIAVSIIGAYYCEGGYGDGGYDMQTFAIGPAGDVHYLGAGLILIDTGDYDGDGESELVMSLSRYNRGGYILFSNTFVEEARFEFGYH